MPIFSSLLPRQKKRSTAKSREAAPQTQKLSEPPLTNAGQGLRHRIGMARKKQRSSLSPRPVCGIEPALHQQHSDGSWYATPRENGNHRRSSAPTSIWSLPKSSRSLQCDGKWRSHSRRRVRTSESKLNASGPKKRSRAPHQYCLASTVWFVSGRTRLWKQIRCHMLQRGLKDPLYILRCNCCDPLRNLFITLPA